MHTPERHSVTIGDLLIRQEEMYDDRPRMHDHNLHFGKITQLLKQEVDELNGKTEDGMSLLDYRRQETADIGWFVFAMIRSGSVAISFDEVAKEAHQVVRNHISLPLTFWSQAHEYAYEQIKEELRHRVDAMMWTIPLERVNAVEGGDAQIVTQLRDVLVYTWALFFLYGTVPENEMLEKMARNLSKHTGHAYRTAESFAEAARMSNTFWSERHGTAQFYETGVYAPATQPLLTESEREFTRDAARALRPPSRTAPTAASVLETPGVPPTAFLYEGALR